MFFSENQSCVTSGSRSWHPVDPGWRKEKCAGRPQREAAKWRNRGKSWWCLPYSSREHLKPLLESVGGQGLLALAVVVWVIGVEPIAFRIDGEIYDLGEFRGLDEELLFRHEA